MTKARLMMLIAKCFVEWNKREYDDVKFHTYYDEIQAFDDKLAHEVMFSLPDEADANRDWENEDYSEILRMTFENYDMILC